MTGGVVESLIGKEELSPMEIGSSVKGKELFSPMVLFSASMTGAIDEFPLWSFVLFSTKGTVLLSPSILSWSVWFSGTELFSPIVVLSSSSTGRTELFYPITMTLSGMVTIFSFYKKSLRFVFQASSSIFVMVGYHSPFSLMMSVFWSNSSTQLETCIWPSLFPNLLKTT